MRKLLTLGLAMGVASAMLLACGGDDNGASPSPGNDASTPLPDSGTPPPAADTGVPPGDAGACNFATFVKGLVANDTNATALPSTNLGQTCTDDQNQADFQSLFP